MYQTYRFFHHTELLMNIVGVYQLVDTKSQQPLLECTLIPWTDNSFTTLNQQIMWKSLPSDSWAPELLQLMEIKHP